MEEIKINIPDGYKIDTESSDLDKGIIAFKKKELTYNKIRMELVSESKLAGSYIPTNKYSKVEAIVKLIKTAYYLNEGWEPNWDDETESKYDFFIDHKKININRVRIHAHCICYFKSRELAEKAIEILGEDTIRLALS